MKAMQCVITEKIDGTNAQIVIQTNDQGNLEITKVGSRRRYITPEDDNFGFAGWVDRHKEELIVLGEGIHFGEWYGAGIQRGYNLDNKKLAFFNPFLKELPELEQCCKVPILYAGPFSMEVVDTYMEGLKEHGSQIEPGYMKPEGIMIYFPEFKSYVKHTFEHTEGKWK